MNGQSLGSGYLLDSVNLGNRFHLFRDLFVICVEHLRNVDERIETPVIQLDNLPEPLRDEIPNGSLIALTSLQFEHYVTDAVLSVLLMQFVLA